MIEQAHKRVPNARFLVLDFYDLKFADNSFDGFWSAASFLHVSKKEVSKVINEAFRVIVAGGIGFISVKEKTEFDEGLIAQEKLGISRYFAFYTEDEFKKILLKLGLKVLEVTRVIENDDRKTVWLCFFVLRQ